MKAILSDIHGNLEALKAVLADACHQGADGFISLGDLVGYGPNPRECLDLVLAWEVALLGNFDQAVLSDPPEMGPTAGYATASLVYARAEIAAPVPNPEAADRRWAFLQGLPRTVQAGPFLFVHGSPRNPLNEYVFPEDVFNQKKMAEVFAQVERYSLMGHTHIPGVFSEDLQFFAPEEVNHLYKLDGRKTLINVGAVGQPRDDDWRASYVLLDGDSIRFRRVEYDVDTTVKKIQRAQGLNDWLGERLKEGH